MILGERLLGEDLLLLGLPLVSEFLLCAGSALSLRFWIGRLESCFCTLLSPLGEGSLIGERSPLGEQSLLVEDLLCCKILVPLPSVLLLGLSETFLLPSEPLGLEGPLADLALVGDQVILGALLLSLVVR